MTTKKTSSSKGASRGSKTKSGSSPRGARTGGPNVRQTRKRRTSAPTKRKGEKLARNSVYVKRGRKKSAYRTGARVKKKLVSIFLSLCFTALLILGGALIYAMQGLPDIKSLNTVKKERGITIESNDGIVLATFGDVTGEYVPFEELPKALIAAVLATEDRRFFDHFGIDPLGILRAMAVNIYHGRLVQGGSTITQQLAKNVFLTPERTIHRKLQEAMLALALEKEYSKKDILTIYLNRVYLGAGVYGIDAASRRYFNKPAQEMTLPEAAMIAGLLKAPSRYAPTSSKERAAARASQVLKNMINADLLNEKTANAALADLKSTEIVKAAKGGDVRYFADWVMEELPNYIGHVEDDLIVTTTLNPKFQSAAEEVLQTIVAEKGTAKNVSQGALVSMSPNGAVRAMVGGVNYFESQYNRAVQAKRQPGSVFKLFVYLAALEAGLSPSTLIEDAPITLQVGRKEWSPQNFGNNYLGEISMAEALKRSVNTVAVRLSQYAGVEQVAELARKLGIANVPVQPSIALGTHETNLLDLTAAYAHLPAAGYKVIPYGIQKIRTAQADEETGKPTVIYEHETTGRAALLSNATVEMMNYMLMQVVRAGTGRRASLGGRDAAGKTGTSQNSNDAWFVGYTANLATGVWLGNDDNSPTDRVTGGSLPAEIWQGYMRRAEKELPARSLPSRDERNSGFLPWIFGGSGVSRIYDVLDEGGDPDFNAERPRGSDRTGPSFLDRNRNNQIISSPDDFNGRREEKPTRLPQAPLRPKSPAKPESPAAQESDNALDDILPEGFLQNLIDTLPEGEVEYEYPTQ